jgi:hypothetical protein
VVDGADVATVRSAIVVVERMVPDADSVVSGAQAAAIDAINKAIVKNPAHRLCHDACIGVKAFLLPNGIFPWAQYAEM